MDVRSATHGPWVAIDVVERAIMGVAPAHTKGSRSRRPRTTSSD